jgi:hypothetical protein
MAAGRLSAGESHSVGVGNVANAVLEGLYPPISGPSFLLGGHADSVLSQLDS